MEPLLNWWNDGLKDWWQAQLPEADKGPWLKGQPGGAGWLGCPGLIRIHRAHNEWYFKKKNAKSPICNIDFWNGNWKQWKANFELPIMNTYCQTVAKLSAITNLSSMLSSMKTSELVSPQDRWKIFKLNNNKKTKRCFEEVGWFGMLQPDKEIGAHNEWPLPS